MNETNGEAQETGTEIVEGIVMEPMADRGAIDVQVSTAKEYPRSVSRFRKEVTEMALKDEDTARECFYVLPRSGKKIFGPSARFAEIVLWAWGNARAEAEVVDEARTHVTAQGTFFDLERNVAIRVRVKRRITDKHGNRYNADMIGVTSNAAISIAYRNAVLKGIPKAVWSPIYEQTRTASLGEAKTWTTKRAEIMGWFRDNGAEDRQVFDFLDVDGVEDIGEDELITLRGLANAIREGEITMKTAFSREAMVDTQAAEDLNEQIRPRANGPSAEDIEAAEAEVKEKVAERDAPDGELPL